MKRSIASVIAVILLCLLSIGVFIYAHGNLTPRGEDVTVTETTLFGDRKEAEGIEIKTKICPTDIPVGSKRLNWNISSSLSESGLKTDTRCFLDDTELKIGYPGSTNEITLRENFYLCYGSNDLLTDYANDQISFPRNIFDAAADKTNAGERHTETIRVSDYLSFYPVSMNIESDNGISYGTSSQPDGSPVDYGNYFAIPVDDDVRLKVTVYKDAQGTPTEIDSEYIGDTILHFESASAFCSRDDCLYTALTGYYLGKTQKEVPKDKCGIHKLPLKHYKTSEMNNFAYTYADLENARMVYPLEANLDIMTLLTDPAGKNLLLFTREQGDIFLSVIDTDTMQCRQKLQVMADAYLPDDEMPEEFKIWQFEDSMLLLNQEKQFSFLTVNNGSYTLKVCDKLDQILPEYPIVRKVTHAYDGSRFAIAFQEGVYESSDLDHSYSVYLMVYRGSRLAYAGYFENSLSQVLHCNDCEPEDPLTISFREGSK